jgi:hypothetical protein
MSQTFKRSANVLARVSIYGAVLILVAISWTVYELNRSTYATMEGVAREQPVPFSHEHHVSGLGLDCRYCHTSVETSAFAGLPSTATCMNCHSQIWADSPMLQPVRASYRTGSSLGWMRVNELPDYVNFNHSIHVNKGVGCVSCHGRIDQMPLTFQAAPLTMEWCLQCHRRPEKFLRPREQVFNMQWQPPEDQIALGTRLLAAYRIKGEHSLTTCSTCHY